MTHRLQGVGRHHLANGGAREGHVGDADGAVSHGDHRSVTRVGDHLQTRGDHAVKVTVNDTDGIADGEGQGLGPVLASVEGLGLGRLEGLQSAVGEGIVTQIGQSRAQGHGEVGHLLLQEGVSTQVGGGLQIGRGDGGVSEGVISHGGDLVEVLHGCQSITVGEGALTQSQAVGIQDCGGQALVVDEGVGADIRSGRKIDRGQRGAVEGVGADGLHALQVDVGQGLAVEEGLRGDVGDATAQLDRGQLLTVGEGGLTDGCGGGEIHRLKVGGVVQVDVHTLIVDDGDGQAAVGEEVEHIAREGGLTHRQGGGEVDALQLGGVVEGEVADNGALAQGHGLQLGGTVEGRAPNGHVLADHQLLHGRGEDVVIEAGIVLLVEGGLVVAVDVQTEGGVADDHVVADPDAAESLALAEGGGPHAHALGNDHALNTRAGEGVVTDHSHTRQIGGRLDGGAVEGAVSDGGELTQLDGRQTGAIREGVGPHLGDLGHIHRGQLLVAREGARTDGGHLGVGQLEGTLDTGSHQKQGVSFLI